LLISALAHNHLHQQANDELQRDLKRLPVINASSFSQHDVNAFDSGVFIVIFGTVSNI